ncbi:tyrosine-type recombinase/integrase [Sciscionella marina]|uniref:tyrosine-type recombinase/integrase n=1 Tax=Sciscionella marina TaxID=508770 RepID=UPI00039B6B3B|nr:site-specific integrase [Sciscionella marina]
MARAWVYDRSGTKKYEAAVAKAKTTGRKPPSRWEVMYYDQSGSLRTEVARNKRTAEARCSDLEVSLSSGSYVDPVEGKVSFSTVAERWIDSRHDLKPQTWWKYRALLDNHVNERWGDQPLVKIDHEEISTWVARLLKSKDEGGSGLGASQARHCYRVLAMVLEWCVPKRLPRNPARGVKLPIRPESEHVYLSYEQIERLASASAGLVTKYKVPTAGAAINRALILLLAYTGMRWGEAAALRIGKVDLKNRRIRVVSTFTEINGVQCEGLPKNGKPRTVPIPASLVPVLREVVGNRGDDQLVFRTARKQSLRANNWRVREFNAAVKAAGLGDLGLTPHKLRHTAASLAIAAGADVKVLQQMLGHATAAMTLDIYGHLFPDRLDEVATKLDRNRTKALRRSARDDAA